MISVGRATKKIAKNLKSLTLHGDKQWTDAFRPKLVTAVDRTVADLALAASGGPSLGIRIREALSPSGRFKEIANRVDRAHTAHSTLAALARVTGIRISMMPYELELSYAIGDDRATLSHRTAWDYMHQGYRPRPLSVLTESGSRIPRNDPALLAAAGIASAMRWASDAQQHYETPRAAGSSVEVGSILPDTSAVSFAPLPEDAVGDLSRPIEPAQPAATLLARG